MQQHPDSNRDTPNGTNRLYADMLLPLPLPGTFTYSVPNHLVNEVAPGKRVTVPFGKRGVHTAVVKEVHSRPPEGYETKDILSVPDNHPVVLPVQMRFWDWLADYYMCTAGEVLKAALPGGFRPRGGPAGEIKPKTEIFVSLHPELAVSGEVDQLPEQLKRAPRQLDIVLEYLHITDYNGDGDPPAVPKSMLTTRFKNADAPLRALYDKNILARSEKTVSRLEGQPAAQKEMSMLNHHQGEALLTIKKQFESNDVVLLNGITSGGKTEIYIHLIKEQLEKGKQVLYLLPEIALTAQIITRLKNVFGSLAGVYHSKFSEAERVEIWNRVLNDDDHSYRLILGVRSSLFLPFGELGLVIVDEEHENTFKQFEPAPRYHARDAAVMLASMHGAKTLLGTATPSVESWYNTLSGKYGLAGLTKRYSDMELPEMIIADTRMARKKRQMKSLFTPQLIEALTEALDQGEQVILFQNRRGYAPYIECADCGWVPLCRHCDVSMTYHKTMNQLVCHYCGASQKPPPSCPECGSSDLKTRGFGTEKVEDEIPLFFPGARVGRLDLDSARGKRSHERIISSFEEGKIDILAGTQMVAKGLDFGRVSLVGILNADNMLLFPDFRAHERSFQLMSQVAGRAGRKVKRGKVIIQTGFPDHPVIRNITGNNLERHFREQLAERREFRYPPFVRLIKIVIKDKNRETAEKASKSLAGRLRADFGNRVLGPEYPPVGRVQNRHIMHILIKIEKGANLPKARSLISAAIAQLNSQPGFRSCQVYPDVDPV
ncbi:MAG: primosomal protein N' [Marinilabiliales bacterium]|nr:MAG: primosomal protein N' [Marinilabiliales bacterium]